MRFFRPAARAGLALSLALGWGPASNGAESGPLDALIPVLEQMRDPQSQLDILKGLSEGLKGQRSAKMPAGWDRLAARLGAGTNAELRALVQSLSLTFGSQTALAQLRRQLMDAGETPSVRASSLEALLGAKDPDLPASLRRLLSDTALRGRSLRGLATYDDPLAPAAVLAVYPRLPAPEKRDALNTLFSRVTYAGALIAALEQGTVPRADLSADIVRQLRNLRRPELDARLEKVWGKSRESGADKLKEIARYKAVVLASGARPSDPSRGRALFTRTCQQCHTLFGVGGKVGPDLTGSNRSDLNYLLENVVDPNAVIPNDYRSWTLETKDDRVITGIMRLQDEKSVTLVTANEVVTVPRPEIRSLQESQFSMMPEGLLTALSDDEVRDLAAYLRSPVQAALP